MLQYVSMAAEDAAKRPSVIAETLKGGLKGAALFLGLDLGWHLLWALPAFISNPLGWGFVAGGMIGLVGAALKS